MRNDDDGVCFMLLVEGTNDLSVGHVLSHVSCHLMLQITDSSSFHISQFKPSHVLCSSISNDAAFDWRARRHLSALELSTAIVLLWHGRMFSSCAAHWLCTQTNGRIRQLNEHYCCCHKCQCQSSTIISIHITLNQFSSTHSKTHFCKISDGTIDKRNKITNTSFYDTRQFDDRARRRELSFIVGGDVRIERWCIGDPIRSNFIINGELSRGNDIAR